MCYQDRFAMKDRFGAKEDCGGRRGHFAGHHAGHQEGGWFEIREWGSREGSSREGSYEGRGRHGGFDWGRRGRFERGFGGGRLFDAGDLKLVILKLLTEQPSYGYQLIKTMEERLSGGYTPSAGVIYPTLTLLEEEGLASVSNSADNKKVYTVTAAGLEYLKENKERIEELFARLEEAGKGFERGRSPEIMRAFMNLRGAVMARVSREVTAEQIKKITEAINGAAKAIDEL
jgi:DNA-binding PadR family transcriptional regulator